MNIRQNYQFDYKDHGYIRKTEFIFTKQDTCIMCREDSGRGFHINNIQPTGKAKRENNELVGFVCLDCMPNTLNMLGYSLEDTEELAFFDLSIARKYAQCYLRYKQGKIAENFFNKQHEEFLKFMYPELVQAIEYVTELDLEYGQRIAEGSTWQGWWLGITGDETNIFFNWMKTALLYEQYDLLAHYKKNNGKRVPVAVKEAQKIVDAYHDVIAVQKKFKR